MKALTARLPLEQLLDKQPKFLYKYLGFYAAASFSRATRLTAILNHYQFLTAAIGKDFFSAVGASPVIWEEQCGDEVVSITLSYPILAGFEGELSVNMLVNTTLLQMVTFVIVPGAIVGATSEQALFISQVQGAKDAELMRQTTKLLHDITPAVLLINATYGLAAALGITCAVGVSTREQLGAGSKQYFDYDLFWQQFAGEHTATKLFLLPIPAPEKPLASIKANHRARTLRKRLFKQSLREAIERFFTDNFLQDRHLQSVAR